MVVRLGVSGRFPINLAYRTQRPFSATRQCSERDQPQSYVCTWSSAALHPPASTPLQGGRPQQYV